MNFKHENIDGIAVSVRELHKRLGIKKKFSDWFKYQCKKLKLVEDKDFCKVKLDSPILANQDHGYGGDRKSVDYITSVDIGKHLCMVFNSDKANEIRWYFIEVEELWMSLLGIPLRANLAASKKFNRRNSIK